MARSRGETSGSSYKNAIATRSEKYETIQATGLSVAFAMKRILIGLCALCALSSLTGLAPQAASQSVTIVVSPETDESYWVWSDEYECWVWNGPEFQGDYQGHPYAYWHGRHEGGGDRDHRPSKGGNVEPAKGKPESRTPSSRNRKFRKRRRSRRPRVTSLRPRVRSLRRNSLKLKRRAKRKSPRRKRRPRRNQKRKKTTQSQRESDAMVY